MFKKEGEKMDTTNLKFSCKNEILRIEIKGDIDHHSAKRTRESIDSQILLKKPSLIIIDLSTVDFMDSSGLGLILGRYNVACEVGAKIIIERPSRRTKRILELAGIERIIEIQGDVNNEAY